MGIQDNVNRAMGSIFGATASVKGVGELKKSREQQATRDALNDAIAIEQSRQELNNNANELAKQVAVKVNNIAKEQAKFIERDFANEKYSNNLARMMNEGTADVSKENINKIGKLDKDSRAGINKLTDTRNAEMKALEDSNKAIYVKSIPTMLKHKYLGASLYGKGALSPTDIRNYYKELIGNVDNPDYVNKALSKYVDRNLIEGNKKKYEGLANQMNSYVKKVNSISEDTDRLLDKVVKENK